MADKEKTLGSSTCLFEWRIRLSIAERIQLDQWALGCLNLTASQENAKASLGSGIVPRSSLDKVRKPGQNISLKHIRVRNGVFNEI